MLVGTYSCSLLQTLELTCGHSDQTFPSCKPKVLGSMLENRMPSTSRRKRRPRYPTVEVFWLGVVQVWRLRYMHPRTISKDYHQQRQSSTISVVHIDR